MDTRSQPDTPALIAELIDLLQLEYDALPVYTLAISAVGRRELRDALASFRDDHQRHIRDLSALLRDVGGVRVPLPHLPTGLLKLGVQVAALPGGDRAILLAFKSNEWQSKAKYARHAARAHPPDVAEVLRRNAGDEARHYAWACRTLEELGCGSGSLVGATTDVFARVHGTNADVIEAAGRSVLEVTTRLVRPSA
ncbi:MAG TPA: ferritin-like domain-containing protein [Azospirillum sp.]|nr:ferritin-like domain-containing protein [Azospirillum sp.]